MKAKLLHRLSQCLCSLAIALATPAVSKTSGGDATFYVATCDTPSRLKATADYVGDCRGDEVEINRALARLPKTGGVVHLYTGTYDIRRGKTRYGGVFITKSNVTLRGDGSSTKLILAPKQFTNVIRILGKALHDIVIKDLYIDANRTANSDCGGEQTVIGDRFECSGINAWHVTPDERRNGYTDKVEDYLKAITVENCTIREAARLNVMLAGKGMIVRNNRFGNAGADIVEILIGPGMITGNSVVIDGISPNGLTTDAADDVTISNNDVQVLSGGRVDQSVLRAWAGRYRILVSGNRVHVETGAIVNRVLFSGGYQSMIHGNIFTTGAPRLKVYLDGGTIFADNILTGVDVETNDKLTLPVSITGNMLFSSTLPQSQGLVTVEKNISSN